MKRKLETSSSNLQSQQLVVSGSQPQSQTPAEQGSGFFPSQSPFEIRYGYGHFYTKGNQWQYSQPSDAGKALSASGDIRQLTPSSGPSQVSAKSQSLDASAEIADLKKQLAEKDKKIEELREKLKFEQDARVNIRKTSELENPSSHAERVGKPNVITRHSAQNAAQVRQ